MGVWIETSYDEHNLQAAESHPVWVCGLKHHSRDCPLPQSGVTPCMGVWIETRNTSRLFATTKVTPCMGVWIETLLTT